jgi:hypothetical protein
MDTRDPVLLAAVALVNKYGGWTEIMVAPDPDFLDAIAMAQSFAEPEEG